MSLFLPNIPQPPDNLDFSQGQLLSNNQGLDTVFGIEHYKFSDATLNKGFHNTVTTPLITPLGHPTTLAAPKLYAMQDSASLGLLQYSRGPSNATPTPLTMLQSGGPFVLAPSTSLQIFDFAGLTDATMVIFVANIDSTVGASIYATAVYDGTANVLFFSGNFLSRGANIGISSVTSKLSIQNNSNITALAKIVWSIQFFRIN